MEEEIKFNTMYAEDSGKTFEELDEKGWEQVFSFHARLPNQWNMAADKAEELKNEGGWDLVLAEDNTEEGKKDTVKYLYKRKKI